MNTSTVVGSFYATANGQTTMQFGPAGAAGGSNTMVGLYNFYNQVRRSHISVETSDWSYTSNTWRPANNSTANRITYLDGLGESPVGGMYEADSSTTSSSSGARVGVNFNSTTATPVGGVNGIVVNTRATVVGVNSNILLGLSWAQAMEQANTLGSPTTRCSVNGCALLIVISN